LCIKSFNSSQELKGGGPLSKRNLPRSRQAFRCALKSPRFGGARRAPRRGASTRLANVKRSRKRTLDYQPLTPASGLPSCTVSGTAGRRDAIYVGRRGRPNRVRARQRSHLSGCAASRVSSCLRNLLADLRSGPTSTQCPLWVESRHCAGQLNWGPIRERLDTLERNGKEAVMGPMQGTRLSSEELKRGDNDSTHRLAHLLLCRDARTGLGRRVEARQHPPDLADAVRLILADARNPMVSDDERRPFAERRRPCEGCRRAFLPQEFREGRYDVEITCHA
jgi:hypothetical protein